jgi:hypothetical protein
MLKTTAFEAAIITVYDAETAVARELVLRLASLLWRFAANAIEADLLRSCRSFTSAASPVLRRCKRR